MDLHPCSDSKLMIVGSKLKTKTKKVWLRGCISADPGCSIGETAIPTRSFSHMYDSFVRAKTFSSKMIVD